MFSPDLGVVTEPDFATPSSFTPSLHLGLCPLLIALTSLSYSHEKSKGKSVKGLRVMTLKDGTR
jgi:hypothetical protein